MEPFDIRQDELFNCFSDVYQTNGSKIKFNHALLNCVDKTWEDRILSELNKDNSPKFNLDVISNKLKVTKPIFIPQNYYYNLKQQHKQVSSDLLLKIQLAQQERE